MPEIPQEAVTAAAEAMREIGRKDPWFGSPVEDVARVALEAAAPILAEQQRAKIRDLGQTIASLQEAQHRKTLELDALHMVWCDGGCPSGVHRHQGEDVLVTEELVAFAERNTERLRRWYEAAKFRFETYGPDPKDPSRQFPSTASEWHRQYAAKAAARTDLVACDIPEDPADA